MQSKRVPLVLVCPILALGLVCRASAQFASGEDFTAPNATVHFAPDRDYDLMHMDVTIGVDWPTRSFTGEAIETLAPLRDGFDEIVLDAGDNLSIHSVSLNGAAVPFKHDG